MVEFDNIKMVLAKYEEPLDNMAGSLGLEDKKNRAEELDKTMEEPGFWDDPASSTLVVQESRKLKSVIERYEKLCSDREDILVLVEISEEENDASTLHDIEASLKEFEEEYEALRIETLLSGEYDKDNAILTLHAGAGGTESCDWASMLCRMYQRWADKKGFSVEMLDFLDGDEEDIRIDTYRASGAGGQHINKTSSAIRITHFPTGIVVQCQNERSQHMNKDKAMQMLKAKLYILKQKEQLEKASGIRGEVMDNGWGSQIRSYVMQPYTMVKDHRTSHEIGNVSGVLDGDLDSFINAYLAWITQAS